MRSITLVLSVVVLGAVIGAPAVGADPGHERPSVTRMRWQDPPVSMASGECDPDGTCDEEILIVKAHDPNSSITEIQVLFSEDDDAGPIVFAHTGCVQGTAPGEPARLEIGAAYGEPGIFVVAAVAYSHAKCLPHRPGDGHPRQHSPVERMETRVVWG
jgi:hypothetical protein